MPGIYISDGLPQRQLKGSREHGGKSISDLQPRLVNKTCLNDLSTIPDQRVIYSAKTHLQNPTGDDGNATMCCFQLLKEWKTGPGVSGCLLRWSLLICLSAAKHASRMPPFEHAWVVGRWGAHRRLKSGTVEDDTGRALRRNPLVKQRTKFQCSCSTVGKRQSIGTSPVTDNHLHSTEDSTE
jgi:hypothetical protein